MKANTLGKSFNLEFKKIKSNKRMKKIYKQSKI